MNKGERVIKGFEMERNEIVKEREEDKRKICMLEKLNKKIFRMGVEWTRKSRRKISS